MLWKMYGKCKDRSIIMLHYSCFHRTTKTTTAKTPESQSKSNQQPHAPSSSRAGPCMRVRVHSYVQRAIPPPNAYYPILNMGHTAKKGKEKNTRNNSTIVWLIPRPSAIHVCTFTASPKR